MTAPQIFAGDPASLEHFLAYKIEPKGEKFVKRFVTLADQFETNEFKVIKPFMLLNPIDKNDEGIDDTYTHLKAYRIRGPHDIEPQILVQNQFGSITLDTVRASFLLVPSAKSLDGPPGPTEPSVGHFKCYKVIVSEGFPKFEKRRVHVFDPNYDEVKLLKVKNPKLLCNPVEKDGGEIFDSETHLLCYKVKPIFPDIHQPRKHVHTDNQFGPEKLHTVNERLLCVPSEKFL